MTKNNMLKKYEEKLKKYDEAALTNQAAYTRSLRILAVLCSSMAFAFLIYDELDMRWCLIAFGLLLAAALLVLRDARKKDYHNNYLKNRMLAEAVRTQESLAKAGVSFDINQSFSWTQKQDLMWVKEELGDLYLSVESSPCSVEEIKESWINDQLNYHKKACEKMKNKIAMNSKSSSLLFAVSIAIFVIALILEYIFPELVQMMVGPLSLSVIIKTLFGELSVISLFISSYYGKLSLDRKEEDHKKMIALYEKALSVLDNFEESEYKTLEELLKKIAKEEISENANWYIYSKENTLDISL